MFLPRWATESLGRAEAKKTGQPQSGRNEPERPLVLYERQQNAMRIAELNEAAYYAGLRKTQTLADARALCPGLDARQIDRAAVKHAFENLADWLSWVSPLIAIDDISLAYGSLIIDITGVPHLFGGEAGLLETLTSKLDTLGLTNYATIADTIGAAWALARFCPGTIAPAGNAEEQAALLGPLPVSALRLTDEQIDALSRVGLKTIGQLYGRDRAALTARFSRNVTQRLDQALGLGAERLVPRLPPIDHMVEKKCAEPVGLLDQIEALAKDLAFQLCDGLERAGQGAQTFHLLLYRIDHTLMRLSLNAARATRDPHHVASLFANRLDRLQSGFDAGFGIDRLRLGASSLSPLQATQNAMFNTDDGAQSLDALYDRLVSRLGPDAILRTRFVNSHIPERALELQPVVARTPHDPGAIPDRQMLEDPAEQSGRTEPETGTPPRPLRLLPRPEPVQIIAEIPDGPPARMLWRTRSYRFLKAAGPERIAVEWWRPGEGAFTRDYFTAEDEDGHRFWIFREGLYASETGTPRWFMHGLFA